MLQFIFLSLMLKRTYGFNFRLTQAVALEAYLQGKIVVSQYILSSMQLLECHLTKNFSLLTHKDIFCAEIVSYHNINPTSAHNVKCFKEATAILFLH